MFKQLLTSQKSSKNATFHFFSLDSLEYALRESEKGGRLKKGENVCPFFAILLLLVGVVPQGDGVGRGSLKRKDARDKGLQVGTRFTKIHQI